MQDVMTISHEYDLLIEEVELAGVIERTQMHSGDDPWWTDSFGTVGTAGTIGSCFGSIGTAGCCC